VSWPSCRRRTIHYRNVPDTARIERSSGMQGCSVAWSGTKTSSPGSPMCLARDSRLKASLSPAKRGAVMPLCTRPCRITSACPWKKIPGSMKMMLDGKSSYKDQRDTVDRIQELISVSHGSCVEDVFPRLIASIGREPANPQPRPSRIEKHLGTAKQCDDFPVTSSQISASPSCVVHPA
jgi:hypothetical protein